MELGRGCRAGTVLQAGEWGSPTGWPVGQLAWQGDSPHWGPLWGCQRWSEVLRALYAERVERRSPAVVMDIPGVPVPALPPALVLRLTLASPADEGPIGTPAQSWTPLFPSCRDQGEPTASPAASSPWTPRTCPFRLRWWSWCLMGSTRPCSLPPPSPRSRVTGRGMGTSRDDSILAMLGMSSQLLPAPVMPDSAAWAWGGHGSPRLCFGLIPSFW